MDDLTALLATIVTQPAEDTPRAMFADALDERGLPGDALRAELIRLQLDISRADPFDGWVCKVCGARPRYEDGFDLGEVQHGRGCYTQSEDGGGSEFVGVSSSYTVLCHREQEILKGDIPPLLGSRYSPGRRPNEYNPYGLIGTAGYAMVCCDITRGFVSRVECTAEAFRQHADAIIWHPTQTVKCAEKGCEDGSIGRPRPGSAGGQWFGRTCDVCDGTGFVPCPCPLTAHPVRRVKLTTHTGFPIGPQLDEVLRYFRQQLKCETVQPFMPVGATLYTNVMWPGVEFELQPIDPVVASLVRTSPATPTLAGALLVDA